VQDVENLFFRVRTLVSCFARCLYKSIAESLQWRREALLQEQSYIRRYALTEVTIYFLFLGAIRFQHFFCMRNTSVVGCTLSEKNFLKSAPVI